VLLIYGSIFHKDGRSSSSPGLLSRAALSFSFFPFPLVQASFLLTISLLLPLSHLSSFSRSSFFLSFFSRARPAGATNMRGELCLPFVKLLDVSLIGTSGGSHAHWEKSHRARRYGEPLTTTSNPHGIMTTLDKIYFLSGRKL